MIEHHQTGVPARIGTAPRTNQADGHIRADHPRDSLNDLNRRGDIILAIGFGEGLFQVAGGAGFISQCGFGLAAAAPCHQKIFC